MDDGSPWRWQGFSSFFLYKHYLEGQDISDRIREAVNAGANLIRVFGMSRYMDGGETPETQFWPQNYGTAFYEDLPDFINLLAAYGMRCEFTVFADSSEIMPGTTPQQQHLNRVVAAVRDLPSVFVEIANEPHVDTGVDLSKVTVTNAGDLLWATGDYILERVDHPGKPDPRGPMPMGRYVTYHGDRSHDGSLIECAKEGHFYYDGWDVTENGVRSYGQACKRPCVNDEIMGASDQPTNRWGDERYTDPEHARIMGAGHALSSAGGTFHSENGCVSKPLNDTELKCARAYFAGMSCYPIDIPAAPYQHDRQPDHVLAPVPHLGGEEYAAKESVSRAQGHIAYALTVLISHGYQPEGQHGWQVVNRQGQDGGIMRVERA